MESRLVWLLAFVAPSLMSSLVSAAGPPSSPWGEPLQVGIVSGRALTLLQPDQGHDVYAYSASLAGGGAVQVKVAFIGAGPILWSACHGGLWTNIGGNAALGWGEGRLQPSCGWTRLDLGQVLRGRAACDPDGKVTEADLKQSYGTAWRNLDLKTLALLPDFPGEYCHSFLASGRYACKEFVITNIRGKLVPYGGTELLGVQKIEVSGDERTRPVWSMTVYSYESRLDLKTPRWAPGKLKKEGTIDIGFREWFRVLSKGDDYYFLTRSGSLYRAPKPAKGTHRKMLKVWSNASDPITAFITDADTGKTFLFRDKGKKPVVFQLDKAVRAKEYDPKLFKPGKAGPETLRRAVGYAGVLQSLGLLKAPVAPKK